LTFALNGKWLAHAAGGHVSMVAAVGWMPWTVFGVQMWLGEGQGRNFHSFLAKLLPGSGWAILVAISLALQIVTHTLPVIYSAYLIVAMLAWRAVNEQNAHYALRTTHYIFHFIHSLTRFLPILLLASLLSAAQLLPLLELAQYSNRSLSLNEATEFALSPAQLLVGLLLPAAKGGHEYVIYGGLIPLLLASFGLTRKNRWTWFYGLLVIFAVLFALGPNNPLHSLFYYVMPGFRWVRTPARIFFVGALALSVLVGFGADRLAHIQWSPSAKKWLTRLTTSLVVAALLMGLGLAFGLDQVEPAIQRSALALAIFIPVGIGLILLRVQRVVSAHLAMASLGLLLFFDLAWFDMSMLRFVPLDQALSPGRTAAEYLANRPGYFRVYSPSYSLPTQIAAATGLSLADGVEPVHLAIYDRYMARAGGYNDAGFSVTIPKFSGPLESSLQEVQPDLKLLGLLNVTYLASAFPMSWPGLTLEAEIDRTFIYRNELALPRAWVAHQAVPAEDDWLGQLEALPDVGNVAIVENSSKTFQPSTFNLQSSTAQITDYTADSINIETKIAGPGWLVVSEIWYPGWQATVNGTAQPIEKVDGLLRGVYLSQPGTYDITMTYHPGSVRWGYWITGLTIACLILTGLWMGWRATVQTQT
jgi:hypothetical protein